MGIVKLKSIDFVIAISGFGFPRYANTQVNWGIYVYCYYHICAEFTIYRYKVLLGEYLSLASGRN